MIWETDDLIGNIYVRKRISKNPSYGVFLITSRFKICKKKRFFQTAKVDDPLKTPIFYQVYK